MVLKVGLVGAGRRARGSHLKVLNQFSKDRHDFVAVCDINPETVKEISELYQVNGYTNIREMVTKEKLDICIVTVPGDAHHSVSAFLSRHGIHQLIETPIAPHPELAQFMIDEATKHNVKIEISENFPFMPVELMTMKIIRSGAIGEVGRIYRLFSTTGYHGISVINDRARSNPIKIHSLKHEYPVIPYTDNLKRHFDKEGFEFGVIKYENGVMGIFMVGNKNNALGRNKLVGFEVDGSKGVIVTNGNQGALGGEEVRVAIEEYLNQGGKTESAFYQREYKDVSGEKIIQRMWVDIQGIGQIEWVNPYAHYILPEHLISVAYMHESILNAVERNESLKYTPERAKTDMEVLLAMQYSIDADGAGVSLPLMIEDSEKQKIKESFLSNYGKDPYDIDGLIDVSFPRV